MSDPPQDAKGIFLAALDVADAAERGAFVERSCGDDPALRQRVEDLLRAYGQSGGPLDKLAAAMAQTELAEPIQEQVGATIGPYKLMEQIGEGGFGLVFVAEQQQPIRRKVALKIIKPGMDTRDVIARFQAERQALALMDHPNIARVLDAGTTQSGHPYFVMELVRGVPITEYCDKHQLTPRERLELFVPVCNAIQHAHLKGIIHRDIKPSNVLVTLHDGKPVVKVIDFGVAKALHQSLTDRTIYTRFAQMIGTPLYMSPEQAEMSGLDIDTRTDVYSLGVLLYELLTGMTPFDKMRLARAAYDELLKIIREEDPPKPSLRLSQSSDLLPSIAALRKTEPARLSKMFSGDLDWIAMKAIEKDRTRRYETANAFAADVLRYLNDEAVEASPPSTAYRLRKFARRYRTVLATAAAFVGLLIAGAVASTILAVWATTAERQANRERIAADEAKHAALDAKQDALDAKQAALDAKAEADKQRDEARLTAYGSGVQLAQRAWEENNVALARELLEQVPNEAPGRKLRGFEWYYLYRLFHSELRTLNGHTAGVYSVTFSPDGRRVASCSLNGTVKIWDGETGKELLSLRGDWRRLIGGAFSADGQRLALAGANKVKIWDSVTGKELLSLDCPRTLSVAFSPDGRQLATAGSEIKIWESATGKELLTLQRNAKLVGNCPHNLAFSPDGLRVAWGGHETVIIWETATGKELLSMKGGDDWVVSVAFSPDGRCLATATAGDRGVRLWDSVTAKELLALKGHDGPIRSVAFSPDGQRLASGSDKITSIWDVATGMELFALKGHAGPVESVAFSPDGKRLVSGSDDTMVKIWPCAIANEFFLLADHVHRSGTVVFSPEGGRLASVNSYGTAKIWDIASGKELLAFPANSAGDHCLAFSTDGEQLASVSRGQVKISDIASGKVVFSSKCDAWSAAFSPDGQRWGSAAFSPDGQRLAWGSSDHKLKVSDRATGKLFSLKGRADMFVSLALSPDGKRLASGSSDNTAHLWDVAGGNELFCLKGHTKSVTSLAFSSDGRRLASEGYDGTVRIWDSATGKELISLKGGVRGMHSVAFSSDGQRLACGSYDGTVRIWDSATGKELASLKGGANRVDSVAFSPDGQRLASANSDGSIKIWETMSVSPELQTQRASNQIVADLFVRFMLRVDVLQRLQTMYALSPSGRKEATTVAQTWPEDASALNTLAWQLAKRPGGDRSEYRKALRYSEEACLLEPGNGQFLNTLGAAYLRIGNYERALETLRRNENGRDPEGIALLVMTQQQLGHDKEAQAQFDRLCERNWEFTPDSHPLMSEAEALLEKPKTPAGKRSTATRP